MDIPSLCINCDHPEQCHTEGICNRIVLPNQKCVCGKFKKYDFTPPNIGPFSPNIAFAMPSADSQDPFTKMMFDAMKRMRGDTT